MFEDSLFATNRRRTPQQRWAALLSVTLQTALVTVLVGLPLFFTEALPIAATIIELPPVPHSAGPPPRDLGPRIRPYPPTTEFNGGILEFHQASKGPIKPIVDDPDTDSGRPCTGVCVSGGIGNDKDDNPFLKNILGENKHWPTPTLSVTAAKPTIVSRMDEGLLIRKVTPIYPEIAKLSHQQGTVSLHAIIGRDGTIQQLQAVSGPPLLIKAAIDAVQQWRYRPYMLNGQAVEVDTQITVKFILGG